MQKLFAHVYTYISSNCYIVMNNTQICECLPHALISALIMTFYLSNNQTGFRMGYVTNRRVCSSHERVPKLFLQGPLL